MNYVKHNFVETIYGKNTVISKYRLGLYLSDYCVNCNKTVEIIMGEILLIHGKCNFVLTLNEQINFLNDKIKCLTEYEFIIKGIIE